MMKSQLKALCAALALAVSFSANAVVVDSFTVGQATLSDNTVGGSIVTSEVVAAGVLGGYRELVVSKLSDSALDDPSLDSSIGVAAGWLNFSNDTTVKGTGKVIWDGIGSSGLGGLDISTWGTYFVFDVLATDGLFSLTITADTSSGIASKTVSGSTAGVYGIAFSDLVGANLTSLNALTLTITGAASLDVSIDTVEVPEPASLALVGLSLLGLGAMRRRQA